MARGGRGSRGGRASRGNRAARGGGGAARPGRGATAARPGRGRPAQELPTAQPGAAAAPPGASVFGAGNITIQHPRMPAERPRGGPQGRTDRRARAAAAMHDFRYVGADLRWIGLTTVLSVALVLTLWAVTRL